MNTQKEISQISFSVKEAGQNISRVLNQADNDGICLLTRYNELAWAVIPMRPKGLSKFFISLADMLKTVNPDDLPEGFQQFHFHFKSFIPTVIQELNEALEK